jgi:hypothetical protein
MVDYGKEAIKDVPKDRLTDSELPPKNPFWANRFEIYYHLVSSAIAASLVLAGAISAGGIDKKALLTAAVSAVVIFLVKMRDYWDGEKEEYENCRKSRLSSILTFF